MIARSRCPEHDSYGRNDDGSPRAGNPHRASNVEGRSCAIFCSWVMFLIAIYSQPRYVVFGTGAHLRTQTDPQAESTGKSSSGRRGLKSTSSKPSLVDVIPQAQESQEQTLYISIYKAKVRTLLACYEKLKANLTTP